MKGGEVTMLRRHLGQTGRTVSILGMGCSRLGSLGNSHSPGEADRTIARALDLGVTLFDTADVYGQGDSERLVGFGIARRRSSVFLVTKGGKRFSLKMRAMRAIKPLVRPLLTRLPAARAAVTARRDANIGTDFSPEHLRRALDASLRRLGTHYVDGYLLHSPSAADLADGRAAAFLEEAKSTGRVHHTGVSCDDLAALEAAVALPGIELLQLPLTLIRSPGAAPALTAAERAGIAVFAREVLGGDRTDVRGAVGRAAATAGVDAVLVGFSTVAHLEDAAAGLRAPAVRDKTVLSV